MRMMAAVVSATLFASAAALAQSFPAPALHAKTVVILNDTHSLAVEKGAEDELKQWGRLKVVDRIDKADLVLSFSRKSSHTATGTNDAPSSYGMTVTSDTTIEMVASTRDGIAPFYKTYTHEAKEKAGHDCAAAFVSAWLSETQRAERH